MKQKHTHNPSAVSRDDQAPPQNGSGLRRLNVALAVALVVQLGLSIGAVISTTTLTSSYKHAQDISVLASRQRVLFQDVGIITRRLTDEAMSDDPNPMLISRIQTQLLQRVSGLSESIKQMSQLEKHSSMTGDVGFSTPEEYPVMLSQFIEKAERLARTEPQAFATGFPYWNEISMSVSPNGVMIRTLEQAVTIDQNTAKQSAINMRNRMVLFNVLSVLVVAAIGVFVILPALKHQEAAWRRERKLMRKLHDLAHRDGLTGLQNRKSFDDYFSTLGQRNPTGVALAMIDLNMFKPINDTFGHNTGDAVLVEIAARITKASGPDAFVARNGGDEFVVLVTSRNPIDLQRLGQDLVDCFSKPVGFEGREHTIGGCVGLAATTTDSDQFPELTSHADTAMLALKSRRKTAFAIFGTGLGDQKLDLNRRDELETALLLGQIVPYYQPKVRLPDRKIVGFEALARWEHPTRGVLGPGDFLDDIDTFGLQMDFTHVILTAVCRQILSWSAEGFVDFNVSTNLSEVTLSTSDGFRDIEWLLTEFEAAREFLTIEVTENVFLPRYEQAIRGSINKLEKLGLRISMDDFGTGYGSFRHLKEFTFHELKIDKEFVHGIGVDKSSEVIIRSFMSIAEGLGADVVAEGIETPGQEAFLASLGCGYGQGFLYAKAIPPDQAIFHLNPKNDSLRSHKQSG